MQLFKAERPKNYTGQIKDAPTKELVGEFEGESADILATVYSKWSEEFFDKYPRGKLKQTLTDDSLVVRGTGDNGRWLVAWWLE